MKNYRVAKWIIRILGIVLLGAIGSGVWQIVGAPVVTFISELIISSINLLVGTYKDSIYSNASKGFRESSATALYVLFFVLPPLIYLSYSFGKGYGKRAAKKEIQNIEKESANKHDDELEQLEYRRRKLQERLITLKRIRFAPILLLLVVALIAASQISYTNRIVTYVENTLDRLAPYENAMSILRLRAQFREVSTAEDYYLLYDLLESKLKEHGLESKSIEPL